MSLSSKLSKISRAAWNALRYPQESVGKLAGVVDCQRATDFVNRWNADQPRLLESDESTSGKQDSANPLQQYFDDVKEGPGIWKWIHYFELYHRHLQKFVGRAPTVVEIGVYSGGSLGMWKRYFGDGCRIHGVDIQSECKAYEDSQTTIHIGDQADRAFWRRFREAVPVVDVVIDDGGHQTEQQMATLEELLPHIRPGGVYICEDLSGIHTRFAEFAHTLADQLNKFALIPKQEITCVATPFQRAINSVHLYPFVVVLEKRDAALQYFLSPKHGTQWQPFRWR